MSEIHDIKNYDLAPPAPKCILQNRFLPSPNPMFPCQDIREEQFQNTLAYAQAIQYWAEKSNLLMPGQTCLLARCVIELRRVMKPYVTFSDDAILDGAALQERSLEDQTGVTIARKIQQASTRVSTEEEPTKELVPTKVSTEEAAPTEEPSEEMDSTGDPIEDQPSQWPLPASQQKSQLLPRCGMRRRERERFPIVISPVGQRYCILPSQWLLSDKPLWLSVSQGEDTTAGVQGGGELGIKEQKNADKLCRQSQIPLHHPGLQNPCQRLHGPQVSRELWPTCRGIPPHQPLLMHPQG